MRKMMVVALTLVVASTARAQIGAIDKAKKAAAATNAHTAATTADTGQKAKKDTKTKAPDTKTKAPAKGVPPQAAAKQGTGTGGKVGPHGALPQQQPKMDSVPSFVMREVFDYDRAGRRDPFVSLLTTSDLRPTINDLHLLGILYDETGHRSVATLRDQANTLYLATVGMTLGRMRVAQIKPRAIIFTIEEFGFSRQDSLVLSDTTKARP